MLVQLEQDEGDDVPEAPGALPAWVQASLQRTLEEDRRLHQPEQQHRYLEVRLISLSIKCLRMSIVQLRSAPQLELLLCMQWCTLRTHLEPAACQAGCARTALQSGHFQREQHGQNSLLELVSCYCGTKRLH